MWGSDELKLLQVSVKNFMVFGDKQQVVKLDNLGLVLLEGKNEDSESFKSNGAGKTTILSSIVYALFGKLPDGTSGDTMINDKTKKGLKVSLTIQQGNHTYRIDRYRKDKDFKNKTLLFQDDKEITKSSIKLTNEAIIKILGIDMDTYLHSVVFGLGDVTNFTQATDKEKKEILEDIANISIYKQAQSVAKDKRDKVVEDLQQAKTKIDSTNNEIEAYKQLSDSSRKQFQTLMATRKQLKNFEAAYTVEDVPSDNDRQETEHKLAQVTDALTKLQAPIENSYQQEYNQVVTQGSQLKAKRDSLKEHLLDLVAQLKEVKNSKEPTCRYCGNILDATHKATELKSLAKEYKQSAMDYAKVQESLKKSVAKYNFLASKIEEIQKAQDARRDKMIKLNKVSETLKGHLKELASQAQTVRDNQAHYAKIVAQLKDLNKQINSLTEEIKSQQVQTKLKTSEDKLVQLQKEYNKLEKQLKVLKETVEIYSDKGVKSHVLDLVLPYVNQRANYYLSELTDNTISVKISTTTEAKNGNVSDKLNVETNNINGAQEYELNSKGERKRIDLAISLALQDYVMTRTNTKTNFIAYDEVFDGLDSVGIDRVMHLLKQRVKEVPTIIVVSHNDELKELFENRITVTKQKGLSTIEA